MRALVVLKDDQKAELEVTAMDLDAGIVVRWPGGRRQTLLWDLIKEFRPLP